MPKKLHQIKWEGGQVDGDNLPGFVTDLLNIEMDRPGALRARDTLVSDGSYTNADVVGVAIIETDPIGDSPSGWRVVFGANGISVFKNEVGATVYASMNYPFDQGSLDADRCEVLVYGERAFFCAVDTDNVPRGVAIVSVAPGETAFSAPLAYAGSRFDHDEVELGRRWVVSSTNGSRPTITVKTFRGFSINKAYATASSDTPEFFTICNSDPNMRQERVDAIAAASANLNSDICGLVVSVRADGEGLYGPDAVVKLSAQGVLHDGTLGRVSDGIEIYLRDMLDDDWDNWGHSARWNSYAVTNDMRFSISIGVLTHADRAAEYRSLNVYREVVDYDNTELGPTGTNELIMSAPFTEELMRDDRRSLTGGFYIRTYPNEYEDRDIMLKSDVEAYRDITITTGLYDSTYLLMEDEKDYICPANPLAVFRDSAGDAYYSRLCYSAVPNRSEGTLYKDTGWASLGSGVMMYVHPCYSGSGHELTISSVHPDLTPSTEVRVFRATMEEGLILMSRHPESGTREACEIFAGTSLPLMRLFSGWMLDYSATLCAFQPMPNPVSNHSTYQLSTESRYGMNTANRDFVIVDADFSNASYCDPCAFWFGVMAEPPIYEPTIVAYRDTGATAIHSEDTINGVLGEDVVDARPRHIAIAGGRLLGLNGFHGDNDEETRLFYSEYRNFSTFGKHAFIDYGSRGDGIGSGLSLFKTKLCIHFTGATYMVDVSGGLDASWRELGAITGVGMPVGQKPCQTPMGAVWYDGRDVVVFDGHQVQPISYIPRRKLSVRETLARMVQTDSPVVLYRESMRQVWVLCGREVLVFDIDLIAWHRHLLTEAPESGRAQELKRTAEKEVLAFADGGSIFYYRFDADEVPAFEWGVRARVDIDVPEIIKKSKRLYVHMYPDDGVDHSISTIVVGDHSTQEQDILVDGGGLMSRFQASIRGRIVDVQIYTKESDRWRGEIESFGMSYKPKRVK